MKKQFIIGVDIGGTNTDGVLIDKSQKDVKIIQHCKTLTSPKDVTEGFKNCIEILVQKQLKSDPTFDFQQNIAFIIIGTTHFINEIIQKSPGPEKLDRVGVLRLCSQVSYDFQAFSYIENETLLQRIQGPAYYCNGGTILTFPSFKPLGLNPLNEKEILECLEELKQKDIHHLAINSVGCLIDPTQENQIGQLIEKFQKENNYPISYTLSHQICNKNGVIYRENAAILNESLKSLAENTLDSIQNALNSLQLQQIPLVISKNDGSFFTRQQCEKYPILCCSASIVNSLKGGQLLYNVKQSEIGIVLDIGGTSTDLAILYHGSARESGKHLNIGGVQFNSERMPQVSTIALGGGTIVKVFRDQQTNTPQLELQSQSIAKNIKQQSVCCNEYSIEKNLLLCTSDFALQFNPQLESSLQADKNRLTSFLKQGQYTLDKQEYKLDFSDKEIETLLELFKQKVTEKLIKLIDSASNGKDQMNILLCGGGSLIVDRNHLQTALSPNLFLQNNTNYEHIGAANALGATQFDITKSTSQTLSLQDSDYTDKKVNWEKLLKTHEQILQNQLIDSGIGQGPFITLEQDYGPTPYGLENQVDIRIKIKAQLNQQNLEKLLQENSYQKSSIQSLSNNNKKETNINNYKLHNFKITPLQSPHTSTTRAEKIDQNLKKYGKPVLTLQSEKDFEFQAWGSGIFGCGGGGSCELGEYQLKQNFLKKNKQPVHIYSLESMQESDIVSITGFVGIPSLLSDRLFTIYEIQNTFDKAIENSIRNKKEITGLIDIELGGTNGLIPLLVSQNSGYPVFDGHIMDRAYPRAAQSVLTPYGKTGFPMTVGDHNGRINHCDMTGEDYIRLSLQNRENEPDFDREKESQPIQPIANLITQENFDKFVQDVKDNKPTDPTLSNPMQLILIANLINNNGIATLCFGNLDKQESNKMLYKNVYQKSYQVGKAMYEGIHEQKLPVQDVILTLSPIFKQFDPEAKDVKILGMGRIQSKISEKLSGGQDVGNFEIISEDKQKKSIKISFQNEYLIAFEQDDQNNTEQKQQYSKILATAPDMICLVDKNNGQPIHSEETVNGIEVICFVMPCDNKAKQDGHIQFVQPTIYGENYQYTPY